MIQLTRAWIILRDEEGQDPYDFKAGPGRYHPVSTANIFEQATRLKLRFDSPRGDLSVEDLWDLPLTSIKGPNLDDIAKACYAETQSLGNIPSFVETPAPVDGKIQLRFDVVKLATAEPTQPRIKAQQHIRLCWRKLERAAWSLVSSDQNPARS